MPTQDLPKSNVEWADKIIHITIHTVLSLLWLLYFYVHDKKGTNFRKQIIWVLTFCVVYGIIIEILQQVFTASRTADILDVCANAIGTFLGLALFWSVKNKFKI
ncbi:hypothetical protein GCM10008083_00240 [Ulvibacter litoralis]|nr:hypothetical protein GCM10008083_00240 [Ulvibacter litoralis]